MNYYDISKEFWTNKKFYPEYDFIKQRRFYEINYIYSSINNKQNIETLTDIGCGDGSLITCLDNILNINKINCIDFSDKLMSNIPNNSKINKIKLDLYKKNEWSKIPNESTIYNMGGVISFIFDNDLFCDLLKYISKQKYNYIFLRSPCSISGEDIIIDTYSKKLKSNYVSIYRTVGNILKLMREAGLNIRDSSRLYPDDIESNYGTKQYMFFITK